MPVSITCPSCQATLRLDEAHLGKKIQCANCKTVFVAAVSTPPAAEEPMAAEMVEEPAPTVTDAATGIQASKKPNVVPKPPPVASDPPKSPAKTRPATRRDRVPASGGASVLLIIALVGGLGLGGFGLLGCLGAITYFMLRAEPAARPPIAQMPVPQPINPIFVPKDEAKGPQMPIELPKDPPIGPEPAQPPFIDPRKDLADPDVFKEKKFPDPGPKLPPPVPEVALTAKFAPPNPAALALKPSKLEADRVTRMLPGTLDDIAVGGGGRFLLFNLPQLRKIGMFDVNEGKVVHYFTTAGDDVKFTAGLTKLVMAFPSTNIIQRWDLITKEKELTVPLDIQAPSMVLMGSASQGPVLAVGGKNDFRGGAHKFLNLATFKEVTLGKEGNFGWRGFHPGYTRVSANGLVFSTWDPGSSPQGLQSYVLGGNSLKSHYQHKSMGHITPGPDGKVLYTSSGRFTAECNPLGGAMENRDDYVVPSVQGDFFLTLKMANRFGGRGKNNVDTNTLSIHLGSDTRPLLNIPDILQTPANDPLGAVNRWDREKFGNDKRFHFIPDADLLVVIPLTNDRLDLRRVNIEQSLEKAGIDYLYVTSRAPEAVQRGTTYQYKLAVKSKKGGLKYKLDSGPQGMKISTDGTVVWKTAADQDLIDESVLVTVSDAAGQEVFHTFKVRVVADPLPKEVAKEAPKDLKFEEPKKEIGKGFDPPKVKSAPVGDIRPVKLGAERVERMLPDTISDICVGGGGRYLLVTLSGQRKVALFDANEGKIVHYFPLASDNARVTAGKEHLVIAYLDTGIFQRWSLATKEKELTVNAPFTEQVKSITMGHNSLGPIFVAFKESGFQRGMPRFLDLKFKDAGIPINGRSTNDPAFPHANADGTLFGFRHGVGGEGHESGLVHVHGKTAKAISIWCATSILLGSPDGRFVYAGTCVYNSDLKPVHPLKEVTQFAKPYLPAVHGPYFMRLDYKQWDQHGGSLALFFQGNYTPFATINNIDGVSNEAISYGSNRDKLTHSQRIFLIPAAKLLVSVPKTNDRLVLHQVDVNELLEKSPIDYLLIASQPPTSITASQNLTYKLDVRSKKGGLKFTLDAGPKGMSISPQGELTWNVPADAAAGDENIIVTIRDAAGQEIFHTFRLSVEAK